MIFVASTSRGKPPAFDEDKATLIIPRIAMRTAGSREGIDCNSGSTSSMIIHLSRDSTNLPRHIKQLTRTCNRRKSTRFTSLPRLTYTQSYRFEADLFDSWQYTIFHGLQVNQMSKRWNDRKTKFLERRQRMKRARYSRAFRALPELVMIPHPRHCTPPVEYVV